MDSKPSFSTSEVARFCHVTPDTVRKWAEAGRIPVFKTPGGHRRIRRDDLVQFLQENGMPLSGDLKPNDLRVLVVDSEPEVVASIRRGLDDCTRHVVISVATNGFDAGHQLGVFQPGMIILDLGLPGIDGFEVCRRIKASPESNSTKIIAMTGAPDTRLNEQITGLGAAAYLTKPFTNGDFRQALQLVGVDLR